MSNKREFKKYVEAVGASACDAMMTTYYNVENADKNTIAKAIEKTLCAVAAARSNANVTFDKGVKAFESLKDYSVAKKAFYKKLFEKVSADFTSQLDDALKVFNSAIPKEVKDENKKLVTE